MSKLNWRRVKHENNIAAEASKRIATIDTARAAKTIFCWRCKKEEPYNPGLHVMKLSKNLDEHGKPKRYWVCSPKVKKETTDEWRKRLFG